MANLDPSILAQFQARNGGGSGGTNYTGSSRITTPEWMYDPVYQHDPSGGEGGTTSLIGYNQYKPGADTSTAGAEYAFYNPDGTFNRHGTTKEVDHNGLLASGLLAAITMGTMLPAAGATAGAAPAGGMANGAFLGEGALSGVPAWESALAAAPAAGAATTGAGFLGEAPWTPTAGGGAMPGGFPSITSGGLGSALVNQGVKAGVGSLLSGGGGSSGGSGGALGNLDLGSIIGGGVDYYNQNKSSDDLLNWLKERTAITDNLYKPGSPEANLMQQEMERKDAAAGRNSQYGVRATDLAAKIAQIKAAENTKLTTGVGSLMKEGLDQRASAPAGLLAALGGQNGGSGLNLSSIINGLGSGSSGTNMSWYDSLFGLGQDGSNAPGGSFWGSDIGDDDWDTWAGLL